MLLGREGADFSFSSVLKSFSSVSVGFLSAVERICRTYSRTNPFITSQVPRRQVGVGTVELADERSVVQTVLQLVRQRSGWLHV